MCLYTHYAQFEKMIQEIAPKSEFLKKYIQSFSILTNDGVKDINYCIFPQIGSTLVLTINTTTKRFQNKIQFINDLNSSPKAEVFGKYLNPVQIRYHGKFEEFSIDFTALGINYFFDKPYKQIAPKTFQEIKHKSLSQLGRQINEIAAYDKKIELAEQYFINTFKEIKIDYLEKAVALIVNLEGISVHDVAQQCNITTRTLNRVFNNYVGCSPQTFKRIVRFRKSINCRLRSSLNYTEVCHDNNFYDSSHFWREFKSFANENPSSFFESISEMGISKFPVKFN